MSNLEFLERLPAQDGEERWLVRVAGVALPRVAWLLSDYDRSWLEAMERDTSPWVGFSHPRVSQIFALAWQGDRLLVTIDDDRGPSLADAAAQLRETPVDLERWVVAQFIAITDGLAAMARHVPDFVHRRLEADRIFVDISGHARLRAPVTNFSFERRNYTGAARIMGTPEFMSPEQGMGKPVTSASDVFALASNLALALTGNSPFRAETMMGSLVAILQGPTPVVETHTAGLETVFARAFAKEPRERYPHPAALGDALRACVPDAADYDACTSDRVAQWWPTAEQALGSTELLGDRCPMQWEQLTPTADDDIRHCDGCQQAVVRVTSLAAVLPLIGKRCVAFTPRR